MDNPLKQQFLFILKIIIGSVVGAIAIKYLAPFLPITANPVNALIMVFLPAVVLGLFLMGDR